MAEISHFAEPHKIRHYCANFYSASHYLTYYKQVLKKIPARHSYCVTCSKVKEILIKKKKLNVEHLNTYLLRSLRIFLYPKKKLLKEKHNISSRRKYKLATCL